MLNSNYTKTHCWYWLQDLVKELLGTSLMEKNLRWASIIEKILCSFESTSGESISIFRRTITYGPPYMSCRSSEDFVKILKKKTMKVILNIDNLKANLENIFKTVKPVWQTCKVHLVKAVMIIHKNFVIIQQILERKTIKYWFGIFISRNFSGTLSLFICAFRCSAIGRRVFSYSEFHWCILRK